MGFALGDPLARLGRCACVRVQLQVAPERRGGLSPTPAAHLGQAERTEGVGVTGIGPNRRAKVGERTLHVVEVQTNDASIHQCGGVRGCDDERTLEVR